MTVIVASILLVVMPIAAPCEEISSGLALAEKFAEQARKVEEAQAAKAAEEERAKAEAARIAAERLAAEAKARAEETRRALEQLKADEAEMLERARAEATARRLERERIEQEKAAEAARHLAEEQEQHRVALEKAAAEKARTEREAREIEVREAREAQEREVREAKEREAREAEEREARLKAAAEQRQKEHEEAARAAESERQAEAARQDEARRKTMEAEREAENARISEILRRAREAREALAGRRGRPEPTADSAPTASTAPVESGPASTAVAPPAAESDAPVIAVSPLGHPTSANAAEADPASALVTVLLVMDPGTKGIRRFQKTADPILCVRESCYISAGPHAPAVEMPRWKAFGTGNTLGKRAGACRNLLTCVFRNVDLGDREALIQPVDMRILRHDRREPLKVRADSSCATRHGRLECGALVASKDWRAWVVPEPVARSVGVEALEAALKSGLPPARSARLGP